LRADNTGFNVLGAFWAAQASVRSWKFFYVPTNAKSYPVVKKSTKNC